MAQGFRDFTLTPAKRSEDAIALFSKAIDLDPNYAAAYGMAAYCRHRRRVWGWTRDRARAVQELGALARQAAKLGKDDPIALSTAGWVVAFDLRDVEHGAALIDRARTLNPSEATAWWMNAFVRVWLGEPELAIEHARRAMRLSPIDPLMHQMHCAIAMPISAPVAMKKPRPGR